VTGSAACADAGAATFATGLAGLGTAAAVLATEVMSKLMVAFLLGCGGSYLRTEKYESIQVG
jgi:hypothetical protein